MIKKYAGILGLCVAFLLFLSLIWPADKFTVVPLTPDYNDWDTIPTKPSEKWEPAEGQGYGK